MKYFLVLGIEYKKYKKPADITIHVGDKFVDTFQLDQDFLCAKDILKHIEPDGFAKLDKSSWLTGDWVERWNMVPSLFKIYELDESHLQGKLVVEVSNSNSDYTNGFMKNSSLIRFSIAALVKKEFVKNRGEKMMKHLLRLIDITETKERSHNWMEQRWPVADNFTITRQNGISDRSGRKNRFWWIGGSFKAEFNIVSMGRTKYLGPVENTEWAKNGRIIDTDILVLASCRPLLNIYDEDQRSNNTKN